MLAKLKNLIKYGVVKRPADDSAQFPVQQIVHNGKTIDCFMLYPFGFHANMDINSLVSVISVEADEANRFAVGGFTKTRPTLSEGELAVFHPSTGTSIKFNNEGTLTINTGAKDVNITAANVNVTGNITVTGDLSVAGKTTLGDTATKDIARKGDAVSVTVTGGSSAGTYTGTITAGSSNNKAN